VPDRLTKDLISGLILAGGQSRRMGGGDKALLDLGGKPVLAHVIATIRPQVGTLILNANGDPERFAGFGLPVVPDTITGFAGPLAGLLAGLRRTAANLPGTPYVASVSSDAPFLPSDLVARLLDAVSGRPRAVAVAASDGKMHPVIGLWPVALADDLAAALAAGLRKAHTFAEQHGAIPVSFPFAEMHGRKIDPFFNANTPEDLDTARALLGT
jgi:molybdopterin-guanine dinucleotide biosynthesis protein A